MAFRGVVVLICLALLALVSIYGVQFALINAGDDFTVTNETWQPDAGNVTQLNDSNLDNTYYDRFVTVYDDNDTEMTAGNDYKWFDDNGTVKAIQGGRLDGDGASKITYSYQTTTDRQRTLAGLVGNTTYVLMALAFLAVPLLLLAVLRG